MIATEFPPPTGERLPDAPQRVAVSTAARWARWGLAARLARRDVRRRPGRTALVMLLVTVPVLGMTLSAIAARTARLTAAQSFAYEHGAADLGLNMWSGEPSADQPGVDGLGDLLPVGSRSLTTRRVWIRLELPVAGRREMSQFIDVDAADPLAAGRFELLAGRLPQPGEVALHPELAERMGLAVGGRLVLPRPQLDLPVVGLARAAGQRAERFVLAPGFDWSLVRRGGQGMASVAVDLPAGIDAEEYATNLRQVGLNGEITTPEERIGSSDVVQRVIGIAGGAQMLAILGIIITAAFAASARRQLVAIGQLSANGADPGLIRRSLALQGSWTGLFGALAGCGVGLVIAYTIGRATIDGIVGRDVGPVVVPLVDLVVIVGVGTVAASVAAFIPARTASRIPTLMALAGRRPAGRVPRRMAPIGAVLFGGGLALVAIGALGLRSFSNGAEANRAAVVAFGGAGIVGGIAILIGACCASPFAVAALGPIGERIGGTGRLAARSLARLRSRNAAVVTAITAAGALAIGGATLTLSDHRQSQQWALAYDGQAIRDDEVSVSTYAWSQEELHPDAAVVTDAAVDPSAPVVGPPPDAAAMRTIERIVPGIVWRDTLAGRFDPAPCDARCRMTAEVESSGWVGIIDPEGAFYTRLDADRQADLDRFGALLVDTRAPLTSDRTRSVTLWHQDGPVVVDAAVVSDTRFGFGRREVFLTEEAARDLGIDTFVTGAAGRAPADLTEAQRRQLGDLANVGAFDGADAFDLRETGTSTSINWARQWQGSALPTSLVESLIIAGALLFTLIVVAIGLALSAAESREERDVLVALGARPRTVARVAGLKAGLVALAGCALAVPTGFLPTAIAWSTANSGMEDGPAAPVVFPWLSAGLLVVAVPLVALGAAWLTSTLAQRFRPARGIILD